MNRIALSMLTLGLSLAPMVCWAAEASALLVQTDERQAPLSASTIPTAVTDALRSQDFDLADKLIHDPTIVGSKNWRDQMWRGQVLGILGRRAWRARRIPKAETDFGEAEAAFRRAIELNDQAPEAYVALVEFFTALKQKKFDQKAEEVLTRARAHLPHKESHAALAQMYEALKDKGHAQIEYEAALQVAPDDPATIRKVADFHLRAEKLAAAIPLLTKLLDLKGKAAPDDLLWARRQLALITASMGGYPNVVKALRMIEENLASGEPAAEDLRAKAAFLAIDPRRAKRLEAAETLETLLRRQGLATTEDRYTLARLYLALGNMPQFREHMRRLLARNGQNSRFVATYIAAELEHDELVDAEIWLDKLEKLAPDAYITICLRADDLVRRHKPDEALEVLVKYLERPDVAQTELLTEQRGVAERLEQFAGRFGKAHETAAADRFLQMAERLCRLYVSQRPKEALMLAGFLARRGRIREALDVADAKWSGCDVLSVAHALEAIVKNGDLPAEQREHVDKLLQAALEKFQRPVPLLLVAASIAAQENRHAEAETCYRDVLAKEPNNGAALNNLAMLFVAQGVKLDEGLRLINHAMEYSGPITTMLDTRAMIYLAMKRPEDALADMNIVIADGGEPPRLFHLARVYSQMGRTSEAAEALARACIGGLKESDLEAYERPIYEKLRDELR